MINFKISTGDIGIDAACIGSGYSGDSSHFNQPQYCNLHDQGPIPPGQYAILAPVDDPQTGQFSMPLVPCPGTATLGRGGFRLHGDNPQANHTASQGCIIASRSTREAVWTAVCNAQFPVDKLLQVIA